MGWSCQHDYRGECKLVQKTCSPGMKGCTLKGDFIFNSPVHAKDNSTEKKEEIDFAALARSC